MRQTLNFLSRAVRSQLAASVTLHNFHKCYRSTVHVIIVYLNHDPFLLIIFGASIADTGVKFSVQRHYRRFRRDTDIGWSQLESTNYTMASTDFQTTVLVAQATLLCLA